MVITMTGKAQGTSFIETKADETVRFISKFWQSYGFPPSYRVIGKAMDIKSTSTVQRLLINLERQGRVIRDPHKKTVRVINNGDARYCEHDWRVRKVSNPLKIECADCGRKTEVEYSPEKDCPFTELLKYTGEVR
jgi:SOS-response transcriptional repressor LexA